MKTIPCTSSQVDNPGYASRHHWTVNIWLKRRGRHVGAQRSLSFSPTRAIIRRPDFASPLPMNQPTKSASFPGKPAPKEFGRSRFGMFSSIRQRVRCTSVPSFRKPKRGRYKGASSKFIASDISVVFVLNLRKCTMIFFFFFCK